MRTVLADLRKINEIVQYDNVWRDSETADLPFNKLTEILGSLLKQYKALLATENVEVIFTKEAVSKLAEIAFEVNSTMENIGARRLHTILETVLEELLFEAPSMQMGSIQITEQYVESKLNAIREDQDLTKYVL